ncbi:MAG: hypothetical protein SFV18_02515 [Bryobacteraceae bacterium]|nr:hypothetical protein [Bryobacteraceae bacterium]
MTVQLEWPPEAVERVAEEARQRGLSLDEYVLRSVLPGATTQPVDEEESRRRRLAAVEGILEIRKRTHLGDDVTIRQLIEEGRRY